MWTRLWASARHVQGLSSPPASCLWRIGQAKCLSELRTSTWEVSSLGRVKSLRGVIHHGSTTSFGYMRAGIDGKSYLVHRLVARAFLGPPPSAAHTQINHINGDPTNNTAINLEYSTPSHNMQHRLRTATEIAIGRRMRPVCFRSGAGPWSMFASIKEAAHVLALNGSNICQSCQGRRKRVGGYEFRYAESASGTGEEWRPAQYPGTIQAIPYWMVSSHGRVKTKSGHITYGCLNKAGYFVMSKQVTASRRHTLQVHRLVAASFFGLPPTADMHVHHLDGNRANNNVRNLEYATPLQNAQHAILLRAGCKVHRPNACKPVAARQIGGPWIHFKSAQSAAAYVGVHASAVSHVCRGRYERAKNWEFKFAAEEKLPTEEWRRVVLDWSCDPEQVLQ